LFVQCVCIDPISAFDFEKSDHFVAECGGELVKLLATIKLNFHFVFWVKIQPICNTLLDVGVKKSSKIIL